MKKKKREKKKKKKKRKNKKKRKLLFALSLVKFLSVLLAINCRLGTHKKITSFSVSTRRR